MNADEVRKKFNDWDFSLEGRIRQSNRMNELTDNEIKNIQLTLGRTDPKDTTFKIKPKQTPEEEVKPKEKEFNLPLQFVNFRD